MGIFKGINLTKFFGINKVFEDVSFEIKGGEKVGLIGANGSGKTTLMRCLLALEEADSGQVCLPSGEAIGYVEQNAALQDGTLWDELCVAYEDILQLKDKMKDLEKAIAAERNPDKLEALMADYGKVVERFERGGGYEYQNQIRKVAFGLGFLEDEFAHAVSSFSGGQKTRICLARALIRQPDFLFLDEPTNHLDIEMVEWLENFLQNYSGGVLIISHDRYFLDQVAGRILELENGRVTAYRGNYTSYLTQKAERLEAQWNAYEKQQEHIAKTEEYIRKYKAGIKCRQARGRESQLSRLERIAKPDEQDTLRLELLALGESAERVAELEAVTGGYGNNILFEKISLLIRRGEGVALVGPNGAGKTTLLKLIIGELAPIAGRVKLGSRVKVGYFAQEHEGLNEEYRLLDELMVEFGFGEEQARNYLGAFMFYGDDVFKFIGDLSGGEKARLALLKLMLTGANFLILDEPTNHLDIPAKEAVEEAILNYPGTFLAVSHDRYFLDKVAGRVLELQNGELREYLGNYSYYREKKALQSDASAQIPRNNEPKNKPEETLAQPTKTNKKSSHNKPVDLDKLELKIKELEAYIKMLQYQLNDPQYNTDPEACQTLSQDLAQAQADIDCLYERYLEGA